MPRLLILFFGLGASAAPANELGSLSDAFNNPFTLPLWSRVSSVEQWGADQNETYDIDASRPGWLTMMPYTCTWYQDWRGPMSFKRVGGDFVVTTRVECRARDGVSIPSRSFSLGGVMVRAPRTTTPATWTPGGENYVFLSVGYGNATPRRWQYEVKTTIASQSTLILSDAPGPVALLQIARLGNYVICLRQEPGAPWQVHQRYGRPDLPDTLQVGAVAYTDWDKAGTFAPFVHNGAVLRLPLPPGVNDPNPSLAFQPDLIARWDYMNFFRPTLPPELVGVDLTNPGLVSDGALLAFLGDVADTVCPQAGRDEPPPASGSPMLSIDAGGAARAPIVRYRVAPGVVYRLDLFDVMGRRRARLASGIGDGGAMEVRWPSSQVRASGIYLVRLQAGDVTRNERLSYTR